MPPDVPAPAPLTLSCLLPSFAEAESLDQLLPALRAAGAAAGVGEVRMLVVNDLGRPDPALNATCAAHGARLLETPFNMGAAEAFLFGLRREAVDPRSDLVLTLDSDGQDDPRALAALLAAVAPGTAAVAQRVGRRPEGRAFALGYGFYRRAFRFFVGFTPDFGNFAAFDRAMADHVSRSPHFDTAYAMALPLVARLVRVPVPRLPRTHGETRMGWKGLGDHALRSMLPHLRFIAMRMASLLLIVALLGGSFALVAGTLRVFAPTYAFPNWATIIAFGVTSICLQLLLVCLLLFLVASLTRQIALARRDRLG